MNSSFILTFSDVISHSSKMKEIGIPCSSGFKNEDLMRMFSVLPIGTAELHNIRDILPSTFYNIPDSYVLIMRSTFKSFSDEIIKVFTSEESNNIEGQITGVNWDRERFHNGRIVENKLNHKLLFNDMYDGYKSFPNIEENIGTIYNSRRIESIRQLHILLESTMGSGLFIEGTSYYDINQCYTPFGQEKKKKKIIGLCIGNSIPLCFKWFHNTQITSDIYKIILNHGDLFIMSEMAAGLNKESKTKLYIKHGFGENLN